MKLRTYVFPILLFACTVFIYIHNLSRGVYGGDSGDLITAAFVGGVAHPPGYPLFTLLGFLLTRFHFWPSPAFAVGLISAFSGALGVLFFYLISKHLTQSKLISIISALILGFSYYFGFYSEIAEVFVLNALLFLVIVYSTLQIIRSKSLKYIPLFFFLIGLSFTNHQIIVLTLPSIFLLLIPTVWTNWKKKKITLRLFLLSLVSFFLGFSVYLYVPIASFHNPILNWDTVRDFPSFFHLFLRKDYGTFSAGLFPTPSLSQRFILVRVFLTQIIMQLTIPVIVLCLLGMFSLFKKNKLFFLSLFIGFLLTGPLFIFYAGFPLTGGFYFGVNERFFLLPIIFLLLFLPFGFVFISRLFEKFLKKDSVLVQVVFLLIPIMLFSYNFPKTNLSSVMLGDTFAQDLLSSLSPHALFFIAGDTITFNTWYEHYVKGIRPDVQTLNVSGNIASPYYEVLEKKYEKIHPHATPPQIMKGLEDILPTDGSVYSVEMLATKKDTTAWIPHGLVLQLITKSSMPTEKKYTQEIDSIWKKYHIPYPSTGSAALALGSSTISDIPTSYADAMLLTANFYLSQYKDAQASKKWIDKAIQVDPTYDKGYSALGLYYLTNNVCTFAQQNFSKAISLNPIEPVNYLLLYSSYLRCSHNTIGAKYVQDLFEKQFHVAFTKYFSNVTKK